MVQVEIKMIPMGDESRTRTIGLIEIGNKNVKTKSGRDYQVLLRKTPPFKGALVDVWKKGQLSHEDSIMSVVYGFDPVKRGTYDLVYRALVACGIGIRNSKPESLPLGENIKEQEGHELCQAAAAYILHPIMDETSMVGDSNVPNLFPFEAENWIEYDHRVAELEEAKRLIDSEIQRLQSE